MSSTKKFKFPSKIKASATTTVRAENVIEAYKLFKSGEGDIEVEEIHDEEFLPGMLSGDYLEPQDHITLRQHLKDA